MKAELADGFLTDGEARPIAAALVDRNALPKEVIDILITVREGDSSTGLGVVFFPAEIFTLEKPEQVRVLRALCRNLNAFGFIFGTEAWYTKVDDPTELMDSADRQECIILTTETLWERSMSMAKIKRDPDGLSDFEVVSRVERGGDGDASIGGMFMDIIPFEEAQA